MSKPAGVTFRHMYYDEKTLDLQVLRKEALRNSIGDSRNAPADVTIHHHKRDDPCQGKQHENFPPKKVADAPV